MPHSCGSDDFSPTGRCRPCWAAYMREYNSKNVEKTRERHRLWKINNPESYKNSHLKTMFGITLEEYNILFEEQGGVCAICSSPPKRKMLAVDHCHTTGKVRGLLCSNCNTSLGLVKEDPDILLQMINYIEENGNP